MGTIFWSRPCPGMRGPVECNNPRHKNNLLTPLSYVMDTILGPRLCDLVPKSDHSLLSANSETQYLS